MKTISLFLLGLFMLPFYSFSQDDFLSENYDDFQGRLSACKQTLVSVINDATYAYDEIDIESDLGYKADDIGELFENLDKFIEENNLKANKKFVNLINKVHDYKLFYGDQEMDCYSNFKELMALLGTSENIVLKERDGVRICRMKAIDLYIYYAFGKHKKLYMVSVGFLDETNPFAKYVSSTSSFEFGLGGEIEVLSFSKENLGNLVKLQVTQKDLWGYDAEPNECQIFPRY